MKELQILIDIRKLVNSETGSSKSENLTISSLRNDEINFSSPIRIIAKLTNINSDIYADIGLKTTITTECSKCLKTINTKIDLNYQDEFKIKPNNDELKIKSDYTIDLWPSIRQEIILNNPMNVLCKIDCKGIKVIQE